jgi:hypothetical protein
MQRGKTIDFNSVSHGGFGDFSDHMRKFSPQKNAPRKSSTKDEAFTPIPNKEVLQPATEQLSLKRKPAKRSSFNRF